MKREISIVMVDDHPIARQGLLKILEREAGIKVVADAQTVRQALARIKATQPDVVILDIHLQAGDGFHLAAEIRRNQLAVEIVFLTFHDEKHIFNKFLASGEKGYILKTSPPAEIIRGIKEVAGGNKYISGEMKDKFLDDFSRAATAQKRGSMFTARETLILEHTAEMKTSKEIGSELGISPRTVESHWLNIRKKLGLPGKHELIRFLLGERRRK